MSSQTVKQGRRAILEVQQGRYISIMGKDSQPFPASSERGTGDLGAQL